MASRKPNQLEQAMTLLIANQARFVDSWSRIEERMNRIEHLLLRLLEVLPEALREKIGIKKQK